MHAPVKRQCKPILHTIACHQPKHKLIFPVADFFTTSCRQETTTEYLRHIKKKLENYKPGLLPKIVVTDMAYGLINSVLNCFNRCNMKEYLTKCFDETVLGKKSDIKVKYVTCSTHFLKNMAIKAKSNFKSLLIIQLKYKLEFFKV